MGLFRGFGVNRRRRRELRQSRRMHPSSYQPTPCAVCGELECDEHCAWCLGSPFDHLIDCAADLNLYPIDAESAGMMCGECESVFVAGDHYVIGQVFGVRLMLCVGCAANEELLR